MIPADVVELFHNKKIGDELEFETEIIDSFMSGRMTTENRDFNMNAYNKSVRRNKDLTMKKRKEQYYLDTDPHCRENNPRAIYEGIVGGAGTRVIGRDSLHDVYEQVEKNVTLEQTIQQIKDLSEDLMLYEHIDFIGALKNAVSGFQESIDTVKYVCEKYKSVGKIVKDLLSGGKPLDELLDKA